MLQKSEKKRIIKSVILGFYFNIRMDKTEREKRRHVINLLNMDKKKIEMMDEEELFSAIEQVEEIRIDAVKEGRFLDADNSKKMLKMLRDSHDKIKKKEIKSKHQIQRQKLDEDFQSEVDSFTEHWNSKILTYQEECQRLEAEHIASNRKNLEEYRDELEETVPTKPKDSSRLLDLKAKIEQLVRVQEYKDAHYIQQKAHELERSEMEKYSFERQKKIDALLDQRVLQHQNEYNSLRKRVLNGLDELELQRKNEYDRLFLKFNNLRKNIETQQSMQSYMVEKSIKAMNLNNSMRQYYNQFSASKTAGDKPE